MAIEMIENSDLPAIANKRNYVEHYSTSNRDLGEKTDGDFNNATGISLMGNVYELVRSKRATRIAEGRNAVIAAVNKAFPVPVNNCQALQDAKTKIDNELYKVNQQVLAGDNAKSKKDYVNALNERLTIIKNKIDDLKCIEVAEQAELEKQKKETLEALQNAKQSGIGETANDKMNKYLVWGISGVMVLAAVIILIKKKSNS